ncbi:ATP phosphoribosyltransferase [Sulfoacidibacillus thermotolerans]|uniref:ATP phosphoribosyltransferase n=1 Tax=Sulfoacidibacillus thermotolerans TaxID=1765684 RepID=A0A2U3D8L4_SULT2|nr:ATP phosphoribosyltransferase [Sulfoacidibacillus thermotolerans]PWI57634.1 ATP phosphoribosyltransferase [Sulfoacidibacillus thermotolerans]
MLTVALAKGRNLFDTANRLRISGFALPGDFEETRRLVIEDERMEIRYLLAKPVDVPTYVEHGAADLGIVGKDILHEKGADVHELLDLGFGFCRLVVAGPKETDVSRVTRVATKYPRYATEYFRKLGRQIEVISLQGSVELAPLIGLAECIVDLVETGRTLQENGLVALAEVAQVSARLVANRRSYQLRAAEVDDFVMRLRQNR